MPRPTPQYQNFQPSVGNRSLIRYHSNGVAETIYNQAWGLGTGVNGVQSMKRSWSGVSTPGFSSYLGSRKNRSLPDNAHSVDFLQSVTASSYVNTMIYSYQNWEWFANPPNGPGYYRSVPGGYNSVQLSTSYREEFTYVPTPAHDSKVDQQAISRLQKAVRGPSANLALAFAERGQTAKLMSNTVYRIAMAARALKRGQLGEVYKQLGMTKGLTKAREKRIRRSPWNERLSSHWLELQYGWKPLLQDVHDAAELLAHHIETDTFHEVVSGSATGNRVVVDYTKTDKETYAGKISNYSVGQEVQTTMVKFKLKVRLDSQCRSILSQTGISNPALLAWELLPFSFVVDWFIPVGNYLASLDAYNGWLLAGGTKVSYTRYQFYRSRQPKPSYSWASAPGLGGMVSTVSQSFHVLGEIRMSGFRLDREVISTFPSIDFPSVKPISEALSPLHMTNGVALLTQIFSPKRS